MWVYLTRSAVDILYLGRIFPKRASIMAKKSLKWIPGLGWFSAYRFRLRLTISDALWIRLH